MNLNISYRHLDSTESLNSKINQKALHLKKYFQGKVDIDWVCSIEGGRHSSDVKVHAGHEQFHAHAEDSNLYKTLDEVIAKLEKQLDRKDQKRKTKIHAKRDMMDFVTDSATDSMTGMP